MRAILLGLLIGCVAGCGGSTNEVAGVVKDPTSPEYGQSVADKLKQDLAADPATAKANASGAKRRSR